MDFNFKVTQAIKVLLVKIALNLEIYVTFLFIIFAIILKLLIFKTLMLLKILLLIYLEIL